EAEELDFSTIRQRRQHLTHHINPFIGGVKLSELTSPAVYDFDSQLRQAGRSLAMRRAIITNLKTCLTFAQGRGLAAQNVARSVNIKKDDREDSSGPLRAGVDFPSRAEHKHVMDRAEGRWRPLPITPVFTGMRASQLRCLRWSDVDLNVGIIHVRQRADAWGTIEPPTSKAGKRDIPLAPTVINTLSAWEPDCPKGTMNLVFPNG